MDNVIPTYGYYTLPVVGLGGSAGALPALRSFFESVPPDPGVAFVVVMHLSRDHESMLAELLQRCTPMPVVKVAQTERLQANTVYVIPPGKQIRSMNGNVTVDDLPQARQRHVVVDLFFRTLADTHGPHATAVVLSGADADGAIGLKRVKERGGLTIVQDPDEAEHDRMPRSAVATGMVDWVLPVADMAARILKYQSLEKHLKLPAEEGPRANRTGTDEREQEAALQEVLSFLRTRTGRNFSYYKRATILRRIGRRMQVNNVEDLHGYLNVLRTRAGESGALLQDLLISVTNFFRDTECFTALEEHIPKLFIGKTAADVVRVWVVACATGEEAYSIAMLLVEQARKMDSPPQIQVFATDLDDDAIRVAREGLYPLTIQADVSDERLRRFFIKEPHGLRVRRELRESVLFAVHDILRDPPFSRIDLLSCRNLLIYLTRTAQARVLDTFHFSMIPHGLMFLGSSESVDEDSPQYSILDKKNRIYGHRPLSRAGAPLADALNSHAAVGSTYALTQGPVVHGSVFGTVPATVMGAAAGLENRTGSWGEMHLKLIDQLAPPSILVDANADILHLSHAAGRFLHYSGGEPSRNLLRLIHPNLRLDLRTALKRAIQSSVAVDLPPLAADLGHGSVPVTLRVVPAEHLAPGLMLIFLHTGPAEGPSADMPPAVSITPTDVDTVMPQLEKEIARLKFHLRETVEQYEVSNEELKASNEELQAMNEELRSATEELETSREELQSINEELTTVNQELKSKVDQLSHANSDMLNLMDATAIATVFLDRDLCITRYTPSAVGLFSLIPTDVGRPLSDLKTRIDYPRLEDDARDVLASLVPLEREVGLAGGRWLIVRVRPYRTLEDHIAGVVIAFVDITERKHDQELLRASEARYSAIVTEATVGVVQATLDGVITFANRCYQDTLGLSEQQLVGAALLDHVHPDDRADMDGLIAGMIRDGNSFQVEKRGLRHDGSVIWLHNSVTLLLDRSGKPDSVLMACNDITERKLAEQALQAALREKESAYAALEQSDATKEEFLAVLSHELRNPLAALHHAGEMLQECQGQDARTDRMVRIIQRQSRTMKVLLDDLLDMSRLRLGRLSLTRERITVTAVIEAAMETVAPLVEAAGHVLTVENEGGELVMDADPVRLSQVISNLLTNAVKYTPEAGCLRLRVHREGKEAVFVVEDNGIGMQPDMVESMFQMFRQAPVDAQQAKGMGIGLALVRAIVSLHGGTARGESDGVGKGSRFTVRIPLAAYPAAGFASGGAPAPAAEEPAADAAGGLDVLIADDNVDVGWIMSEFLQLAGHRTRVAVDGRQAWDMAAESQPDVMLLDIGLPGMDGYAVARAVRAEPWGAEIFLIAATGWGQEEDRQRAMQAGFDVHLVKPIDSVKLTQLIAERSRPAVPGG